MGLTDSVTIVSGYQPGLIAKVTQLHITYYAKTSGFGQHFESVVASGMANFCERLHHPRNRIWVALRAGEMIGAIAIDGQDLGDNMAHLRWFITDDSVRGTGVGRRLLSTALAFTDEQGFDETRLWTFSGLSAARHLYEACGFTCIEEHPDTQWGVEVMGQCFARRAVS